MFACEYNNPCLKSGATGPTGPTGPSLPSKISTTFDFKLRLTGERTLFNNLTTLTSTVSTPDPSFNFNQSEFLYPTNMGIFVPINPTYPYVRAKSNQIPTWGGTQISNNHHLFYVMPKSGIIIGYTLNFCANPYGGNDLTLSTYSNFGVGIAYPSIGGGGGTFTSDINIVINSSIDPNSSYSSAYHNISSPIKISAGSYLGCFCLHHDKKYQKYHAQGDTHMTVHVVFDE